MAKNTLPEDFKDDILAESMNGRRRYQMISNADGTVSFVDVTEYSQVGSNFGQAQINATNVAVNESADKNKIIDSKEDLLANTQAGMMAGALAVKEIRSELNEKYIDKVWSFDLSVDAGAAYNTPKNIAVDGYTPYAINTFSMNYEKIIISRLAFYGNNLSLLLYNIGLKANFNLTVNVRYKKI